VLRSQRYNTTPPSVSTSMQYSAALPLLQVGKSAYNIKNQCTCGTWRRKLLHVTLGAPSLQKVPVGPDRV
jgi:hypothetical protein